MRTPALLAALLVAAPVAHACTMILPENRPDLSDAHWVNGHLVTRLGGRPVAVDVTTGVWAPSNEPRPSSPSGLRWDSVDDRVHLTRADGECGMWGSLSIAIDGALMLHDDGSGVSYVGTAPALAFAWLAWPGTLHVVSTGDQGLRTIELPQAQGGRWQTLAQGLWLLSANGSGTAWVLAADGSFDEVRFPHGPVLDAAAHPQAGWALWTGRDLHRLQGTASGWRVTHLDRLDDVGGGSMAAVRGGLVFGDGTTWSWSGQQRRAVPWPDLDLVPTDDGRVALVQAGPRARLALVGPDLRATEIVLAQVPLTAPAYRGPPLLLGSGDPTWALAALAATLSLTAIGLLRRTSARNG